jgi:hypothetical protein
MECKKERITYRAKPQIYDINKYRLNIFSDTLSAIQNLEFILLGNFLKIRNVYLSASNNLMFDSHLSLYNPFSAVDKLSAQNLPFTALKINDYSYTEKYLIFEFPHKPKTIGYVDVLVENEAGYSKLSQETVVLDIPICNQPPNFQKPCTRGIQIIEF